MNACSPAGWVYARLIATTNEEDAHSYFRARDVQQIVAASAAEQKRRPEVKSLLIFTGGRIVASMHDPRDVLKALHEAETGPYPQQEKNLCNTQPSTTPLNQ